MTQAILGFAHRQYGVVSRQQLLRFGIGRTTIESRQASGGLIPVFRGVYGVGREVTDKEGLWMAGVLAAGNGSALAGRSAAALWGILDPSPVVEVLRRAGRPYRQRAVGGKVEGQPWHLAVRRTRHLPAGDRTMVNRIPVTSVARTFLDLSRLVSRGQVRNSFLEAGRKGILDPVTLDECGRQHPGWEGAAYMSELARDWHSSVRDTSSVLEGMFLTLCRRHDLELPAVNVEVEGFEVDCIWRSGRLIVELDGYAFHGDRAAFERDRERDLRLQGAGFTVLRFTYRMVDRDPTGVAAVVRDHLGHGPRHARNQASSER